MSRTLKRRREQRRAEAALEKALAECEDPDAKYHVREALQLVRVD